MSSAQRAVVRFAIGLLFLASTSLIHAKEPPTSPCPKSVPGKPNWFRGFWVPRPSGKLAVHVDVTASDIDCTGLPTEITVPNRQVVTLDITYPTEYTCTTTLSESATTSSNTAADLIAAFAKAGVIPFIAFAPSTSVKNEKKFTRDLPPLSSEVMTAAVKCEDKSQSRTLVQNIKITYQNPPHISASVGLVIARGVPAYGVKTAVTGTNNGVITTQSTVAVTSLPAAQVVPFTFANIYWAGSPDRHIDSQIGLGVNPNLSTPRIEFFASPLAFAWHDVYLSPGLHIGEHEQLANGFNLGDVLPNGVSKAPINWKFYVGFGFSLSYNLHPLVKGK
jgi:hypothetical protein